MKIYDLAVVGTGMAGTLATIAAAEGGLDVLALERGHGLKDRRSLVSGWFGRAMFSMARADSEKDDFSDPHAFAAIFDMCRKANGGMLEQHISASLEGLPLRTVPLPFYQLNHGCGYELSQHLQKRLGKADVLFGTNVNRLSYNDGKFVLHTNRGRMEAKKCIISTGSHSVEWIRTISTTFGIPISNSKAKLGVRVEVPSKLVKPFLKIAGDLRLESDNVLFDDMRINSLIGDREDGGLMTVFAYSAPGKPSERTTFMASVPIQDFTDAARLIRIVNTLSNDKVKRERGIDFVKGHSVLEHIDQFHPICDALLKLDKMLPSLIGCATIHIPEMRVEGSIEVNSYMGTDFCGLYGAGECVSRVKSPFGAMASALVAVRHIMEEKNG